MQKIRATLLFIAVLCGAGQCSFGQLAEHRSNGHDSLPDIQYVLLIPVTCNSDIPFEAQEPSSGSTHKRAIAAVLAFPLPFGILGLHRVYLGTKPYIPVAYMGTIGGCLGILPLVDFFAILTAKEETFQRFRDNPKVFMWTR